MCLLDKNNKKQLGRVFFIHLLLISMFVPCQGDNNTKGIDKSPKYQELSAKNVNKALKVISIKSFFDFSFGKIDFTENREQDSFCTTLNHYSMVFVKMNKAGKLFGLFNIFYKNDSIQYIYNGKNLYKICHKTKEVIIEDCVAVANFVLTNPFVQFFIQYDMLYSKILRKYGKKGVTIQQVHKNIQINASLVSVIGKRKYSISYEAEYDKKSAIIERMLVQPLALMDTLSTEGTLYEHLYAKLESILVSSDFSYKPEKEEFDYKLYSQDYTIRNTPERHEE